MKVYYDTENTRLVYIEKSATPDFWDNYWETGKSRTSIERTRNEWFILKTLRKYIPDRSGLILEGGCGRGQVVYCMNVHGYKSVGVDFAQKTIDKIKETVLELDVRVGDVRNLQFPDNHFTGYWSLGVIEHFWDGYHDILREMQRVLINGGYVFLGFPYMSPWRRLKAKLGLYKEFNRQREGPENFYQFALDPGTVIKDFEAAGFECLEKEPINGVIGLIDKVSLFKPLLQKLYVYPGMNFWARGFKFVLNGLLHPFAPYTFLVLKIKK